MFQHDSPDGTSFVQRLKHFYSPSGYSRWTAGENILYNTGDIEADTAIQAWLDSPPHRRNMLDPEWREVGIGSVHASTAGGTFGGGPAWVITMDFGARTGGAKAATKVVASLKNVTAKKAKKPREAEARSAGPVEWGTVYAARRNHTGRGRGCASRRGIRPPSRRGRERPTGD